jgi:meso-butanediol dehydrogenase / (S,S)-butanediol dehydrogenase / diacetyl reductase
MVTCSGQLAEVNLMDRFTSKSVIVTGGASGIGLSTAKRFAQEGARVAVFDCNEKAIRSDLAEHPELTGFLVDVRNLADLEQAFQKAADTNGPVDVLVANAGVSERVGFLEIPADQWRRILDVNLNGVFLACQIAARQMMNRNAEGVILATSSTNAIAGNPYYADYNASKAGVLALVRTMSRELAPRIRVNAVCPGYVLTPMQEREYTPEAIRAVNQRIPIGRHADPGEIAALFAFLASEEGRYLTGSAIFIDGGDPWGS